MKIKRGYCPQCYRKALQTLDGDEYCEVCAIYVDPVDIAATAETAVAVSTTRRQRYIDAEDEPPLKLYPELSTDNRGRCLKCCRDGVHHKTAIICPKCRDVLGGF